MIVHFSSQDLSQQVLPPGYTAPIFGFFASFFFSLKHHQMHSKKIRKNEKVKQKKNEKRHRIVRPIVFFVDTNMFYDTCKLRHEQV